MASSTLITDYTQHGTHASRPTTPNVPTGAAAIYYETDTGNSFIWSGAAWVQMNSSVATASVVQTAANGSTNTVNGAVFSVAPTAGNLLIALVLNGGAGSVNGTGWTSLFASPNGSVDEGHWGFKIAGVGESTTQTPSTDNSPGVVVIFEVSNGVLGYPTYLQGSAATNPQTVTYPVWKANTLFVGVIDHASTSVTISTTTGMDTHTFVAGANRHLTYFTVTQPTAGLTAGTSSATTNTGSSYVAAVLAIG